jgi:hypothetical protein
LKRPSCAKTASIRIVRNKGAVKVSLIGTAGKPPACCIFSLEIVEDIVRQRIEEAFRNLKLSLHEPGFAHDLDGNERDQLCDRFTRTGDDDLFTGFNGFDKF